MVVLSRILASCFGVAGFALRTHCPLVVVTAGHSEEQAFQRLDPHDFDLDCGLWKVILAASAP